MRSRRALLALLLPAAGLAFAADFASPVTLHQPVVSDRGLFVEEGARRAVVASAGSPQTSFALRPTESLTAVAETAEGWVAVSTLKRPRRDRTEIVLHRETAEGYRRARGPRTGKRALLLGGVPLVERGQLVGLAWLQGASPRSARVRAADWSGVRWGPTTTVAPPAEGSQTGLAGAVLDNGDWLLVWSAFDGQDDELMWSLRRGANWSAPRRLTAGNRVPDVAPTVVATRGGALVTWNRLEGENYRLILSQLRNGAWSAPRPIAGPGAVRPAFHRLSGRLHLLYKQSFPAQWVVLDLDEGGAARRQARSVAPDHGRPVLELGSQSEPRLRWSADSTERAEWRPAR